MSAPTSPWPIMADPETVLRIVGLGDPEYTIAWCRLVVIDRWSLYALHPFDCYRDTLSGKSWAIRGAQSMYVYCPVRVHMVPEEEWMRREFDS